MKYFPFFLFFLSCGNSSSLKTSSVDSLTSLKDTGYSNAPIYKDSLILKDSLAIDKKSDFLGIWDAVGDDNASFVIAENGIEYLDQGVYKYSIFKDSMRIIYEGYEMSFHISMKGADTLVMAGDSEQVFYRFK